MSPELRRRIAFTVGVLLVYRLGTYIPLPGIDLTVWKQLFRSQPAGVHAMAIFALFGGGQGSWFRAVAAEFEHGRPAFLIATAVVIILLALLYTAFVLDPDAAAEKLKAHGGVVPGVAPGEATAAHLDYVVSRTVVLGAAYLALIALIPDLSIAYAHLPFYFDSMSALVVVCVVLDISAQVRGDGLMTARGIRQ